MDLHSYSKPLNLGHKFLDGLFDGEIVIQEKTDGSQCSFGLVDGELKFRSRKAEIHPESPGMFSALVESVTERKDRLVEGWTYRGEYFSKPKHNTLAYQRVPKGNVILFDVDRGVCDYVKPWELSKISQELDLEAVPLYYSGPGDSISIEDIEKFLDRDSVLGGVKIEGVVIKNYGKIDSRGKVLMGKLVSDRFREKHSKDWKKRNPPSGSLSDRIIAEFGSEARWRKAVQHLEEQGELVNAPQDIGLLMKEIPRDFWEEEKDNVLEFVYRELYKDITRGITKGFPEWYKEQLNG